MDIKRQLTQHLRKYTEVPEKEIQAILAYFRPMTAARKVNLLESGQVCKYHYFVGKGCLRMFFTNEKGHEQTSQFAIENWWLTDHLSYSTQQATDFFIQAVEPCELLAIDFTAQERMLSEHPCMERYFRRIYEIAYRVAQQGMKVRYDLSGEDLYFHFVQHYPGFADRIPQYLLASYLGITPEYLSEIKKNLRINNTRP